MRAAEQFACGLQQVFVLPLVPIGSRDGNLIDRGDENIGQSALSNIPQNEEAEKRPPTLVCPTGMREGKCGVFPNSIFYRPNHSNYWTLGKV